MKKLFLAILLAVISPLAFASYSVTGVARDGHGNPINGTTTNIYVQFDLMGCNGNTPRASGTVVDQHPRFIFDASGNVLNEDGTAATIFGNNEISCPSGYFPTQWAVTWYLNNSPSAPASRYTINAAFDLNTAIPNTTNPVVTPPTGDGTYIRSDGGNSPVSGNLTFTGYNSSSIGTSGSPITSALSLSPNFHFTRWDNTAAYTRNGDNIVGGFNTWGSLMRLDATSSPNPASTVGAFATLISTVSSSTGGNVAPNFNIAGGDSRLAAYFGGWRDAGTDRAGQAINVLQECDDINTHACSAAEFDLNQRDADDTNTGVSYVAQFASGGAKKITAGIGISSTAPAVNGMRYGLVIGGYLTSGIIVNPSLTVPSAPAATLNGTTGSQGVLTIGGWDFNAFKYTPVNDTSGVVGTLYKADGTTRRMATFKRGALAFYDTTNFDGTATLNLPHGKCIGWENLATGATLNGICSNAGDDGFALAGPIGIASGGLSLSGQITSTLATGTAPFSVASTTPVANLTAVPTTYNAAGTQQTGVHIVIGHCTLGTSCSITLTGSAVFTSSSSYECSATDETAAAAVKFAPSSGSAFALTGTGTDVLSYHCIGN